MRKSLGSNLEILRMRWSQLKKRVEERMCDRLRGRVQVWTTVYRGTHDAEGRSWLTLDGEEIASMATLEAWAEQHRLAALAIGRDPRAAWDDWGGVRGDRSGYWDEWRAAEEVRKAAGSFAKFDFTAAVWCSLQLSIENALESEDAIIRGMAMIDRRLGKRRFLRLDARQVAHPLVQRLYQLRAEAEGWPTVRVAA
jgi:hypothetical protein